MSHALPDTSLRSSAVRTAAAERPERTDRTDRIHRIERELPRPFQPARSSLDLTGPYTLLRPFRGPGEAYLAATPEGQLCVLQLAIGALPGLAQQAADEPWLAAAEARRAVRHPALIALLDVGVIDDSLYIVTEYLAGRDLHEIVLRSEEKQRALSLPLLLHISRELSAGLGQLHRVTGSGRLPPTLLAHGALFAENVLCGWEGEVKLADRDLSGLFSSVGLRTPWSMLRPPARPVASAAAPTRADDLAGLSAIVSEVAGGAIMGLSSSLLSLLQQATGGKGSAPPWVAPLSADDLHAALSRELALLPGGLHEPAAATTALLHYLTALYGEQIDQERHEAARWLDAVSRTASRSSGRPASRPDAPGESGPALSPSTVALTSPTPPGSVGDSPSRITQPNLGEPASSADALIIDGRYRLLRLIGIGGMGAVYEAQHVSIGKRIAVKVLHQQFSQHPDLVERLRREAQAASRIGHPNIIDVIDFGYTSDGSAYIAMEFLEGTDLGAILRNEGRVHEPRALRIGLQTARALAAAHRVGIVHRDLKPENIFVVHPQPPLDAEPLSAWGAGTPLPEPADARPRSIEEREASQKSGFIRLSGDGQSEFDLVKVLDFGVAAHLGAGGTWPALPLSALPPGSELRQLPGSARLTNPGLAVGTPEYMAPEQALGQEVDARADVYAVGTLMFEMLCGRVPFVGGSAAELLALKTGFEPPLPRLFAPTISPPLESFILRCLARDRSERPQSMEEVELHLYELTRDSGALSQPRILPPTSGPGLSAAGSALSPALSAADLADRLGTLSAPAGSGVAGSPLGSASSHGPSAPSQEALPAAGLGRRPPSRRLTATAGVLALTTVAVGFVTARYLTRPHPTSPPVPAPSPALVGAPGPSPAQLPAGVLPSPPSPSGSAAGQVAGPTAPAAPPADARVVEVLEGRVPMLFEWARRTVAGGRFVSPPGDNLLELLTRIEDVAPNHPDLSRLRAEAAATVLRRGREHLRRRQPLEAFELYRTLLAIEGGTASLTAVRASAKPAGLARRFPRSELQLQLLYVARTGRGGHGAGLSAAHAAVELAPRSAAAHLALADALLSANRREAAAAEYRRVLELHPRALERRLAEHGLVRLGLRPSRRERR